MDKRQKVTDKKARYPAKAHMGETGFDKHILFPVLLLVGIGMVMVYSASSAVAMTKFGSDFYFLRKQALFAAAGISFLILCRHIPFKVFWYLTYPLLIGSIILLAVIHIPGIGYKAGGATRWISIGGYTFQPSELARIALIFFLAYSLSKKHDNVREPLIGFLPHIFVLAIFSVLLYFQPDFGTIVIFGIITWIMMFIAGVPLIYLSAPLIFILPLLGYAMIEAPYRFERLLTFHNPWQYAQDGGYQVIQSLMAFGSGGLFGAGIGQGYQKLFYLPESHTDFIFSVIGEELGLLGVICILALYIWIIWRGLTIARKTENVFGSLIASGITLAFALQVCINMGVALGLLPTKGLTLPFISYGGTSLLVNMAAMGVLMNVGSSGRI